MFGFARLRRIVGEVRRDIAAARSRDPAARDVGPLEILVAWPGVHALLAHRVAHALHAAGVPLLPRMIAYVSRAITGIEIHPAAKIGGGFFIDHGMGVVIGETAELGDDVTLYQGVTLGGTGFATGKRHPTVQDNVTIGSGREAARADHRRSRLQDRREQRRDPRRAAELHGRRQSRVTRCGWRVGARRVRTRTGYISPTRSPTRSRALRAGSRRSSRPAGDAEPDGNGSENGADMGAQVNPSVGPNPAGG